MAEYVKMAVQNILANKGLHWRRNQKSDEFRDRWRGKRTDLHILQ